MKTLLVGTFLVVLAPGCLGQCTSIPLSYCGRTDQNVASGAAPTLGASGTTTTDPDFGSKVLRVTASGFDGEPMGYSYSTLIGYNPSFSYDDDYFLFTGTYGRYYVQPLNPSTTPISFNGSVINANGSPNPGWYTPQGFSAVSDILYGWGSDYATLQSWDLNTSHAATSIVNFKTSIPGYTVTTMYAPLGPWWDHSDGWFCTGSDEQDTGTEMGCYNKSTGHTQVLNLAAATEQQNSGSPVALDNLSTSQLKGCGIHETELSFDGTWATITVNGCTAFPKYTTSGIIFWELGTNHVTYDVYEQSSHNVAGYGSILISKWSNSCNSYDSRSWAYKDENNTGTYASPHYVSMPACLNPPAVLFDAHESWFGNQNDANVNAYPFIMWSNTNTTNTGGYMEWEIDAIQTGPAQTQFNLGNWGDMVPSTIWRLAHTYNDPINSQCPQAIYTTLAESFDGKYISFSSDWGGQTGKGTCNNNRRIDVFILDAATSVGGNPGSPRSRRPSVQ